ncbi:MAG: hypothetical protein K0B81_02315 [Candidatus Cloacimonetes bacterium]|nr:hypothetical protein [Candidatus Cloacimonadota bacterium]
MKTNQALIKKEVIVLGKKLFIPVWILAAIYAVIILMIVFSLIYNKGNAAIIDGEALSLREVIRTIPTEVVEQYKQIGYVYNYIAALSISILFLLTLALTTNNALNVNHRDNYELFHRAQPVSILRKTMLKFIAIVGSNWLIFFGLCLINFLITNAVISILLREVMPWNFWFGFIGLLHWAVPILFISAIFIALTFLVSALFQDAANTKFVGIIFGFWIIGLIFNNIYGWNIPSPFDYIFSVINIGWNNISSISPYDSEFTLPNWSFLINWKTLVHIVVGAVFLYLGTIIYSKREIKQ